MAKSLIIALYLVRNYVWNPFVKKYKYLFAGLIALLILFTVVVAFKPREIVEESLTGTVRELLGELGLSLSDISAILSMIAFLTVYYTIVKGGMFVVVAEEAEYEILLSQPISLRSYFAGKSLSIIMQYILYSMLYVTVIPIVALFTNDVIKAVLAPFILGISLAIFPLSRLLSDIIRVSLSSRKKYERIMDLGISLYVIIGLIDTVARWYPSPLLTWLFQPTFNAMLYCFSRGTSIYEVSYWVLLIIMVLLGLSLIITVLGGEVYPENIRPLYHIAKEKLIWSMRPRKKIELWSENPEKSLFKYVVGVELYNAQRVLVSALMVFLGVMGAYFAKTFFLKDIPLENLQYITVFITPFIVSMIASGLINILLAQDLAYLWIYRVYLRDQKPFARILLIKYYINLFEAFTIIGLINTIILENYVLILTPIAVLPLITITAPLVLVIALRFASRRRVVKTSVVGLYVVEDIVMIFLWSVLALFFIADTFAFTLISYRLTSIGLFYLSITSIIIAYIIHRVSLNILTRIITSIDIAG